MIKSTVYDGNSLIGEAEIYPKDPNLGSWIREIRISHLSRSSGRCPPLAVMHTIATAGICFKMESPPPAAAESPLFQIYTTCLRENKTAVVPLGEEELHLVAISSRKNLMHYSYFWGFIIVPILYDSCTVLLNLRCLGIVFDLDETLVVANSMRTFEDKIDALQRKISNEVDPQRVTSMLAEIKYYQDDKSILKQYIESDQVVDNGQVFAVQSEIVPPLSDSHQLITRPIIRIQEKNIILTRVNPTIRDTSVLVRLRPAWEDLRSYLTARGRKRFEVYVCTMAERDYALEMWRLLDPEANLINSRELLDRIVCVKSGLRKSLLSVFQNGICHPKMALVIDDRLKVWDERDQFRVHVVPAFAPYSAPQAEANNSTPVLCIARNVACNIRGGFFKDFDENLLPHIKDVLYEGELINFPSAPDVGNYLVTEDDASATNGNKDTLCNEGTTDVEAERRLKDANCSFQVIPSMVNKVEPRPLPSLQHAMASSCAVSLTVTPVMMPFPNSQCSLPMAPCGPLGESGLSEPTLHGSLAREEGKVPESELDPDMRRLLILQQMIGYIENLERLGFLLSQELATDLILQLLPDSYSQFVMNYNMNEIDKSLPELLSMLRTAEQNICKDKTVLMVKQVKFKGKEKKQGKKLKKKGKYKGLGKPSTSLKPKGGVAKDCTCFHCGEIGHWKRNCPVYLDDLKNKRREVRLSF